MQPSQTDNTKIYIGNLPFTTTQEELEQLCSEFGELVEVKLITDFNTGRSKGFGFAKFATEEAAQAAIAALHEQEMNGRKIFVKVARPKEERPNRFQDRRGGGGGGGGNFRRGGYSRDNRDHDSQN